MNQRDRDILTEVEETVKRLTVESERAPTVKEPNIREEIRMINSKDQARQYYLEHLIYNKANEVEKRNCLKSISVDELKFIYSVVYEQELKTKTTKEVLLSYIEQYFRGIDRALSMKP